MTNTGKAIFSFEDFIIFNNEMHEDSFKLITKTIKQIEIKKTKPPFSFVAIYKR